MDFDWDESKSEVNFRERGFDYEFASMIFDGPTLESVDDRKDYGEVRIIAVGRAADICVTLVYTDRTDSEGRVTRRIISARRSNQRERKAYEAAL